MVESKLNENYGFGGIETAVSAQLHVLLLNTESTGLKIFYNKLDIKYRSVTKRRIAVANRKV
jgi:hypothetical protein